MKLPEEYQFLDYGTDLYAPQSTLDEEWKKNPDSVASYAGAGGWEMAGNDVYSTCCRSNRKIISISAFIQMFRRHIQKKSLTPSEADESGYRLRFSLEDGDKVDVGGYVISRKGDKICTDRSCPFWKISRITE